VILEICIILSKNNWLNIRRETPSIEDTSYLWKLLASRLGK
jgi:hypothetical protein